MTHAALETLLVTFGIRELAGSEPLVAVLARLPFVEVGAGADGQLRYRLRQTLGPPGSTPGAGVVIATPSPQPTFMLPPLQPQLMMTPVGLVQLQQPPQLQVHTAGHAAPAPGNSKAAAVAAGLAPLQPPLQGSQDASTVSDQFSTRSGSVTGWGGVGGR